MKFFNILTLASIMLIFNIMSLAAEEFHIPLGSDVIFSLNENPSTGYRWEWIITNNSTSSKIEIVDMGYFSSSNRPGAGGVRVQGVRADGRTGRRDGRALGP
jgi:predicted secreted protein